VRRYLAEFLSDPRVVALPRLLWLPVLHALVLTTRAARSASKYAEIWTAEGSPLAVHTARQAALLGERLGRDRWRVEFAMRYGEPAIAAALARLAACDEVRVLPLYPQYSGSTTQSVRDAIGPALPMVEQFHDHPGYIGALTARVRRHWEEKGRGEALVMSFHGLPRSAVERGDPYEAQCRGTARLLAGALGLQDAHWRLAFQSRFGPARWLQPYTSTTLAALARGGVATVDVICPGFVADCLETLHEIAIEARDKFRAAGGGELRLVPCLNESPEWIAALAAIATGR
jgi:ferrochelatase